MTLLWLSLLLLFVPSTELATEPPSAYSILLSIQCQVSVAVKKIYAPVLTPTVGEEPIRPLFVLRGLRLRSPRVDVTS
jgi:hypothetical protein